MKTTYLAVNGNAGAYVPVPCSMMCRKVRIAECRKSDGSAYAPQGLRYKFADGVVRYGVPGDAIEIGNEVTAGNNQGPIIGHPAQNAPAEAWAIGTAYVKGDQITDDGFAYIAIADTTGEKPVLFKNKWAIIPDYKAATVYVSLLSDSANATQVEVTEIE